MALERVDSMPVLPRRPPDAHKGLFGTVLALAGGRGMAGAAGLVGAAALRSGAGLVRVLTSAEVQPTVASYEPCYMTYPVGCDDDGVVLPEPAKAAIGKFADRASVLAIGPGLGQSDGIRALVRWTVESLPLPLVIDADGLNALAGQTDALAGLRHPVVITPHPGEFARLVGRKVEEVQADREAHAVALAQADHLVVVLKGARTIVTDGTRLYVNSTGNPGMATGGTGDVLTGVIAALVAQKLPPFEAAQLGVYIHGLAGDIARDQNGELGMIAGDIVDVLADAFFHLTA